MKQRVIGLVGYKRTGKSTLRKHLEQTHGMLPLPFATPLKDAIRGLRGQPRMDLDNQAVKAGLLWPSDNPRCTVRKALEGIGNVIRSMDADYFCKRWEERLDDLDDMGRCQVVVEDVNFPNELVTLQKRGALIIYLRRQAIIKGTPWKNGPGETLPLISDLGVKDLVVNHGEDMLTCTLDSKDDVKLLNNIIREYLRT